MVAACLRGSCAARARREDGQLSRGGSVPRRRARVRDASREHMQAPAVASARSEEAVLHSDITGHGAGELAVNVHNIVSAAGASCLARTAGFCSPCASPPSNAVPVTVATVRRAVARSLRRVGVDGSANHQLAFSHDPPPRPLTDTLRSSVRICPAPHSRVMRADVASLF